MGSGNSLNTTLKMLIEDKSASDNEREIARHILSKLSKVVIEHDDAVCDEPLGMPLSNDLRMELAILAPSFGCVITYDSEGTYARGKHDQAEAFRALIEAAFNMCSDVDDVDVIISVLRKMAGDGQAVTVLPPSILDCDVEYAKHKHIGKRKMNKAEKIVNQ